MASRSSDSRAARSVRAEAARLNARVATAGSSLDRLLARHESGDDRDAALLRALLSGSLRWHHRLEAQLERLVTQPVGELDPKLAALLRIGLFQLQYMRIPDHAAVSATVDAAAALGLSRARGLVNAVLRRYLRERDQIDTGLAEEGRWSHPQWLIDALRADWPDDWQRILEANNALPPMWVRVNLRRGSRGEYLESLRAAGLDAAPEPRAPAALLLTEPCPTARLPGFAEGLVSVQDAAAQLAAGLLAPVPGERILDACAAPGGKTAHILESCEGLAEVVAIDRDPARLEHVRANLDRLGLAATLVAADAAAAGDWWDGRPFDRILLDAPCSATGVIRRHPDIKVLRRPADVEAVGREQAGLLDALWPLVASGGCLLYATCSVLRAENEQRIRTFLERHPDAICPGPGGPGPFQILPGEANMDGFYYACLSKITGR